MKAGKMLIRMICMTFMLIMCTVTAGCANKNTSNIPTLEEMATMSDEEATECLKGLSWEELIAAWGEPTICFMGLPGDRWLIEDYEKEVSVGYNFGADSEEDLIVISVRISDVDTTTLYE